MSEEIKNNIVFDRDYWPKTGTKIPFKPSEGYDLFDLWDDFGDQADVFIAETLLSRGHSVIGSMIANEFVVDAYAWEVGCDSLVIRGTLSKLIKDAAHVYYEVIRSEAQAEDVRQHITSLVKLEDIIVECKRSLYAMLEDWTARGS